LETVLFLCTGNYYRSRFAEEYFNYWAGEHKLDWRADSRGLRQNMQSSPNSGPMATDAVAELRKLGIQPLMASREPLSVCMRDFTSASKVIALCESEHRPMMAELFPMFENSIDYWHIEDYPKLDSKSGMQAIRKSVTQLIAELSPVQMPMEGSR
jgi:protein-tyrosine phosphatase